MVTADADTHLHIASSHRDQVKSSSEHFHFTQSGVFFSDLILSCLLVTVKGEFEKLGGWSISGLTHQGHYFRKPAEL